MTSLHKEVAKAAVGAVAPLPQPVPAEGSAGGSWQRRAQGVSKALHTFCLLCIGLALARLEWCRGSRLGFCMASTCGHQ